MYVLSTGCQWRAVPKDLPAPSTLHDDLGLWRWSGTVDLIHHALYIACREQAGESPAHRPPLSTAKASITLKKGGGSIEPHGYNAGKKIKGKKRHILVDT